MYFPRHQNLFSAETKFSRKSFRLYLFVTMQQHTYLLSFPSLLRNEEGGTIEVKNECIFSHSTWVAQMLSENSVSSAVPFYSVDFSPPILKCASHPPRKVQWRWVLLEFAERSGRKMNFHLKLVLIQFSVHFLRNHWITLLAVHFLTCVRAH